MITVKKTFYVCFFGEFMYTMKNDEICDVMKQVFCNANLL